MSELIEKIQNLDDLTTIKEDLKDLHPYDVAKIYDELDEENQKKLLSIFTEEELAEILSYEEAEDASDILEDMPEEKAAAIINEMESDDAQDIIDEMEDDALDVVKKHLDSDILEDIENLSRYEDGTAGAIMNPNFVKVLKGTSVKDATKYVSKVAADVETISTIFVVDDKDNLIGTINLKELIIARMPKLVDDVMLENFISVTTSDNEDVVAKLVKDYDLPALPVLENGKILGIITMDDAFDALTEAAEEDYAKLAGLTDDEEDDEKVISSVKKRIPWLAVLLVLDIIIAIVISRFDSVISNPSLVILTFFQAALLGLSGNCGTQSLALSVRRIANGETKDKRENVRHFFKDVIQSLLLGVILAVVGFILVLGMLLIKNAMGSTYELAFILKIGLVLSLSIFIAVIISNLIGSLIPLFFDKIHIDPAAASGPFITTLNDIISVVIYYSMAMIIFANIL